MTLIGGISEFIASANLSCWPKNGVWSDETHLSTIEPSTQTPPRFSFAYGNQSWPQDFERTSRTRSENFERVKTALTTDISDAAGAVSNTSGDTDETGQSSVVSFSVSGYTVLKKRSQFIAAAKAEKQGSPSMMVQARHRVDDGPIGVGFTCSKKVGNSVARNRAKRRLRAAAQKIIPQYGQMGYDYVLIGRRDVTADRPFHLLCQDLQRSLHKLHSR